MGNEQIQHYERKLAYEIDAYDLNEALRNGEKVVVIDARSPEAFRREHITGALSIPHRMMDAKTTKGVPKDALIVTYCDGYKTS